MKCKWLMKDQFSDLSWYAVLFTDGTWRTIKASNASEAKKKVFA